MEIKINKKDETSWMESIIEKLIDKFDITKQKIMMTTKEQQALFILTILSILYKEKCYEEYIGKKLGEVDDISQEILDEIMYELKQDLEEDLKTTVYTIRKYGGIIEAYLQSYFYRKNTNYISEKYNIEIIKQLKKEKEYIKITPLSLNQLIYYDNNPLTQEEIIIAEINEFNVEAEQIYIDKSKQLNHVKKLMQNNYKEKELDEIILFIIRNTYQEIEQDLKNPKRNEIMYAVENQKVKPEDFVSYFKENKKFSNTFLENFINYNLKIEEGRLEDLKKKESYEKINLAYPNLNKVEFFSRYDREGWTCFGDEVGKFNIKL